MKKDNKKVKLELEILELESRLAPQIHNGDAPGANGACEYEAGSPLCPAGGGSYDCLGAEC